MEASSKRIRQVGMFSSEVDVGASALEQLMQYGEAHVRFCFVVVESCC